MSFCLDLGQFSIRLLLLLSTIPFLAMSRTEDGGLVDMPGGLVPQSAESAEIKSLVDKAVTKIAAESNGLYQLVPVRVLRAQSQVVAGTLYHLRILVGQSSCPKGDVTNQGGVCAQEGSNVNARKVYTVKIWQKPWEDFEEITYKEEGNEEEEEGGNKEDN